MTAAAIVLTLLGTACEVVGVLVLQNLVVIPWRRLLGLPPIPTNVGLRMDINAKMRGKPKVLGRTVEQEIAALWQELGALERNTEKVTDELREGIKAVERQVRGLEARVPAIIKREAQAHRDGVLWVATGAVLVGVGGLLSL